MCPHNGMYLLYFFHNRHKRVIETLDEVTGHYRGRVGKARL